MKPFSPTLKPRVTISGAVSTLPVSLLMAMMGRTMPSSLRWRRSLIIKSSTTSVRLPESMQTRPTLTLPALRAPSSSNSRISPLSISMTLPTAPCIAAEQVIDQPVDRLFVARDNAAREDDRVALFYLGLLVIVDGGAAQGRH